MWSLTPPRTKRISGPKKFRSSAKKDFFQHYLTKADLGRAYSDIVPAYSMPTSVTWLERDHPSVDSFIDLMNSLAHSCFSPEERKSLSELAGHE
jgi:hypothetical protein